MLHPYAFADDPFQVRVWFAVPRFYVKGLRVFHATAELNKKYMKTKILSLLVVLMSTWSGNVALAQFTSDKVLIYVKAGIEPSKALNGQAIVIGYFSDEDEIRNMSTDANSIRKTISSHPSYFKSPYNLPDYCSDLSLLVILHPNGANTILLHRHLNTEFTVDMRGLAEMHGDNTVKEVLKIGRFLKMGKN